MRSKLDRNIRSVAVSAALDDPDEKPSSTLFHWRQSLEILAQFLNFVALERQLQRERDQLALWIPVAVGTGIAIWFMVANAFGSLAIISFCVGFALTVRVFVYHGRIAAAGFWFAVMVASGSSVIALRTASVAAPVLQRPTVVTFYARIEKIELLSSRAIARITLDTEGKQKLPARVRVNIALEKASLALQSGAIIKLRARLMPPATAALPGAYNFAERAWYQGLGASGQALGAITIVAPAARNALWADYRARLSAHVQSQMSAGAGAIAATLATGDRGAIVEADAEAMRNSGLAHLLSISGLHVTAVVGATYLLVLKLLALSPTLALRVRLPIVAAASAALAALAYTLLTGAQVPTIRACVAALLVLTAMIIGRSAITLRMVAVGALFVLLIWPESLIGPSFQLSFAAVTAIIALHEHRWMKTLIARRQDGVMRRIGRIILSLFLTGLVVEVALMPIALFHFHKAGIYGALANIIAIPLTTFVIMPLEALALVFDSIGLGTPFWWLCDQMLGLLLQLAHFVSSRPGAVTLLPTMSLPAFGLVVYGGLWLFLWRERWRFWGLLPIAIGSLMIVTTRAPDLYITGDGKHVALRSSNGELLMMRNRSGDFIRDMLRENAGIKGEPLKLEDAPGVQCNADSCSFRVDRGGRNWVIVATRSNHYIAALELAAACRRADILISSRWLPKSCTPRWLKVDRNLLAKVGGMTIDLETATIRTVRDHEGSQPWMRFEQLKPRARDTDPIKKRQDVAPKP